MRIKKTSATATLPAQVVNTYDESQENTYSCDYINENDSYSTNEIKTNQTWIDGKPIYRKVIYIGSLPNNSISYTNHNISNLGIIIKSNINWYDTSDTKWFSNSRWDAENVLIKTRISSTQIEIEGLNVNWSARTSNCYAIIEYTKTTD